MITLLIGRKIKNRRLELGLSQEEVGKAIGTSRQTISRYETGAILDVPTDRIEALANALQTTPASIVGWEEKGKLADPTQIDELERFLKNPKTKKVFNKIIL